MVSHTYTQIKWRFSNFVIESGPSRLICYKPNFLTYCVYLGLLEIEMTNHLSHYALTFLIEMLHCYRIIIPNQVDFKLSIARAVTSLTVPGGQEFHFPHFFLKFQSIFPQTLLIFFLILALRVGESPTREGPGYATEHS